MTCCEFTKRDLLLFSTTWNRPVLLYRIKLVQRWKHKALTTLYTCLLIFLLRRRGWRGVPPSSGWESSRKTTKMSCNRYKMVVKCAFGTFFSPGQSSRTTFSKKIREGAENKKVSEFLSEFFFLLQAIIYSFKCSLQLLHFRGIRGFFTVTVV